MAARILHLVLITVLVGCPTWCRGGVCCSESGPTCQNVSPKCCSHCSEHSGTPQKSQPDESTPGKDTCDCQCICAGAIVQQDVSDDLIQLERSLDWIAATTLASIAGDHLCIDSPVDSPHHHRAISGRMICNLHMALLC